MRQKPQDSCTLQGLEREVGGISKGDSTSWIVFSKTCLDSQVGVDPPDIYKLLEIPKILSERPSRGRGRRRGWPTAE